MLIEDDYDYEQHADFVSLVEAHHGYPATSVQWQPASSVSVGHSGSELIATSGDALRVWETASDGPATGGGTYVGSKPSGGHRLTLKSTLSGVRRLALMLFHRSSDFAFVVKSATTRKHGRSDH